MVIRLKSIKFVLILAISFSIPLISFYPDDTDLFGAISLSADDGFEASGDEDLSIYQGNSNLFIPTAFSKTSLPDANLIEQPYLFSYQLIFHSRNSSILLLW